MAPPEHRELIHEQVEGLAADHVVVEPYPRGNAAAIGLAMAVLHAFDPEAVVAVLPSDHIVERPDRFRKVLIAATAAADRGHLVTLGIEPKGPDTGFGYIEAGDPLDVGAALEVRAVKRFVEKPDRSTAEKMIAAGHHYWNAGMFVWRVDKVLEAYGQHLPKTAKALGALERAHGSERYEAVLTEVWEETDRTTIDYGIAEKADRVAVVPADIGWHDVGSWERLADIVVGDASGGVGDQVSVGSRGVYSWAPGKVVALIGVSDLVVVDTGDVLLIAARDSTEAVREVVEKLRQSGRDDLL